MTKRELNSTYPDPSSFSSNSAAYNTDRDRNLVYASGAANSFSSPSAGPQHPSQNVNSDKMGESFNNILPTHKKMKLEATSPNGGAQAAGGDSNGSGASSRVVHIRGVPPETTVNDLLLLSHSFGTVTNTLLMKSKGQAFVEFQTPYQAQTMTQHWEQTTVNGVPSQVQITLRGRNVKCQLSAHKELKTRIENNNETEKSLMEFQNNLDKDTTSKPSPVIRVVIENMHYAVTLEMLHSVFSRAGGVQKIVTFMKNGAFQALVQYAEISDAIKAKQTLNGQHLFLNANVFRIEYSKTQNLVVKYNNEKSCDYTKSLPNGDNGHGGDGFHFSNDHLGDPLRSFQFGRQNLYGGNNNFTALGFSPVLFVSGLSDQVTPDALFTLFGVYGDVMRVKIMFNKKETALIQLAEGTQAQMAIAHLDRQKLYGQTLRVNSSKHQTVQMPKDGFQDSGLTKDFTNSPLHRFKRPGSKNYHNIYPPSETLHVSNIPPTCTEENIREAFLEQSGMEPTKFRFFPNDNKMALVQFNSVESAIIALTKMHNYKVADHSHLRVSFSKSSV